MVWRLEDQDTRLSPRKTQKPEALRRPFGVGAASPIRVGVGRQGVDRSFADVETCRQGAFHLAQDTLEKEDLLDGVGEVRTSQREVL